MVSVTSLNHLKFSYKKSDYDKVSHFISNVDWFGLYEDMSVQDMYNEFIFTYNIS